MTPLLWIYWVICFAAIAMFAALGNPGGSAAFSAASVVILAIGEARK